MILTDELLVSGLNIESIQSKKLITLLNFEILGIKISQTKN
jgi:hypothetical protein